MAIISTGDNLKQLGDEERLGQNRESEYLGAEDIDPGTEPIVTIEALWNGNVTTQRGKENKDVITFVEKTVKGIKNVRPLIINATNRKTIKKIYGGLQSKVLKGKQLQLYVDHKVRDPQDGGLTDGIRIRPIKPKVEVKKIVCEGCGKEITPSNGLTAAQLAAYTKNKYGKALCSECASIIAQANKEEKNAEAERQ